jgi:hypothetical protein
MPKGQGYSYGNGLMSGTTKSNSTSAPGENKGGNLGKPIGDTGKKNPKGNRSTKCPADRY